MKLFLTSGGLSPETTQDFLELLDKKPEETKICFINTAAQPEEDKWFVEKDRKKLLEMGFKVTEMDIKGENEYSLKKKLEYFDVVFVEGGNTFYLLKYVKESGFGNALKPFFEKGGVYFGVSAGSVIAGLNIESAGWKHMDRNIVNLKDLTGLKLVPFVISVHIDESNIKIIKNCASKVKYPVVALSDQQAFLVENGEQKIVGIGDKLIFNSN